MLDTTDLKSVADFNDADTDLQLAKETYLRRQGWDHTSSTPGSYWMWRKTVGDVDWFVDFETAWRIQGITEADAAVRDNDSE